MPKKINNAIMANNMVAKVIADRAIDDSSLAFPNRLPPPLWVLGYSELLLKRISVTFPNELFIPYVTCVYNGLHRYFLYMKL
jgi:hypothetical protein